MMQQAQKLAEEALRKSEQRFRRYFELGLIGMAITSPEKGILEVNGEICRILGYERSEMLEHTWASLTHPEDLARDVVYFDRVMAREIDGYSLDKRWIRKDGQVIDATISIKCVRNDDGSVDYFVALLQDITARKRAERELENARIELEQRVAERTKELTTVNKDLRQEIWERKLAVDLLRESNDRVEMILDSITDRFFAFDSEWRYTRFNNHSEEQLRLLGKNPASMIGKVLWDEFPNSPTEDVLRRAMRERTVVTDEHYYAPLGEWVENRIYPCRDGGLAVFQRYVTERKRAEEKLRRSEADLAEAQRLSHTGSGCWNVSTGEVSWSDETYRIYGFHPGSVEPSAALFFDLVHRDERLALEKTFEEVARDGRAYDVNFRIVRPNGVVRHIHSVGRTLFDPSGVPAEVIGTVMDVTERTQAAEELRKAQAELVHISRVSMLGAMVDSIAHELNQPLAVISASGGASLRWLDREIPDLNEARRAVELMVENALRAGEIITRIRSLGRMGVAQQESLDVNVIIRDVIVLAGHELANNSVVVKTELQPGLSPIHGDRIQLQQVVLNLILNANDAMSSPGWPVRELTIKSEQLGSDEVVVSVQDSGCGLSASESEHIFDPLFSTKTTGLGLGLWISRRIVEAHGGRIWATPNTAAGTTLHFALPVDAGQSR